MTARGAANAALDLKVDAIASDANTADELFAIVDVLDDQPTLRRSLSDPSASDEDRAALAQRLVGSKVSAAALAVLTAVVQTPWSSGNRMVEGLERQGVRLALRTAQREAVLDQVVQELYSVAHVVDNDAELATALRLQSVPLAGRRELIDRLIAGKTTAVSRLLAGRAVAARRRTFSLTISSYLEMAAAMAGEKIARVVVARPLDEGRLARLKAALSQQAGANIVLQVEIDPAVLGGISVHIEDHVIESTVAARLEAARRQLHNL